MALNRQRLLLAVAALGVAAIAIALISQYAFGMQPCAWCVLQRLIVLLIAVSALWGAWGAGRARPVLGRTGALVACLLALCGVAAAYYQYSVASNSFSCELTFADRFMVASGLDAHLPWIFGIFASCMDARVEVLGLEYALWSLLLFVILAILSALAFLRA